MPQCKTCGSKYKLWSSRRDGLCSSCGAKADLLAEQQADKEEAERNAQRLETARTHIDLIVHAMTDEQPLGFLFVHRGVFRDEDSAVSRLIVTKAGGIAGIIIGQLTMKKNPPFWGELGILVVTHSRVIEGFFRAEFASAAGTMTLDHLKLFRDQLASNTLERREFEIHKTPLAHPLDTMLILGAEPAAFALQKADLCVNDASDPYPQPSINEICDLIGNLGPLITPTEAVDRIARGTSPIPEPQFNEIPDQAEYVDSVFRQIREHVDRAALASRLGCVVPPMRKMLLARITRSAESLGQAKVRLFLSLATTIGAIAAAATTHDAVQGCAILLCLAAAVASLVFGVSRHHAAQCRDILRNTPMALLDTENRRVRAAAGDSRS